MGPTGSAPRACCIPYFFQSTETTDLVIAQADCWYCSGTRLAKRNRVHWLLSGQVLPP